ncbi:hypothetical protein K378_00510 [Streptomyces sp. Amel2xB2]|uniref:hypothetical protein n=1 Tax=Streptomyces sp. Amel2xB2 TaxID=1305829 RepID=UPI000DBF662A|nr:hypothetical protein [Streptomyces sp. Amel2xB2]RAJ71690.1 hypothetical protein K378_00510 [Streptomyces sp. Amel2xB2]
MKIKKALAVLGASAAMALGFGGVMAPSAQAHSPVGGDAGYTQTDLRTGTMRAGAAFALPGGSSVSPPAAAASLRCWDPYLAGRTFAVSCSGTAWRVFVDCTNNTRYVTPVLSGAKRVAASCPLGTSAVRGGAFGR